MTEKKTNTKMKTITISAETFLFWLDYICNQESTLISNIEYHKPDEDGNFPENDEYHKKVYNIAITELPKFTKMKYELLGIM